jgi:hypothetical protein
VWVQNFKGQADSLVRENAANDLKLKPILIHYSKDPRIILRIILNLLFLCSPNGITKNRGMALYVYNMVYEYFEHTVESRLQYKDSSQNITAH